MEGEVLCWVLRIRQLMQIFTENGKYQRRLSWFNRVSMKQKWNKNRQIFSYIWLKIKMGMSLSFLRTKQKKQTGNLREIIHISNGQLILNRMALDDNDIKSLFLQKLPIIKHLSLSKILIKRIKSPYRGRTSIDLNLSISKIDQTQFEYIEIKQGLNQLTDDSLHYLKDVSWPLLQAIQLNRNLIKGYGLNYLRSIIAAKSISINLNQNQINDIGALQISKWNSCNITFLGLHDNHITDKGIQYIVSASMFNIKSLYLSFNYVTCEGICLIIQKFRWKSIKQLQLQSKYIPVQLKSGLQQQLERRIPNCLIFI